MINRISSDRLHSKSERSNPADEKNQMSKYGQETEIVRRHKDVVVRLDFRKKHFYSGGLRMRELSFVGIHKTYIIFF